MFDPAVQSGLLGQYSESDFNGPASEDESAYSSVNPPPDRATELANLLSLFPNGTFAARRIEGYDVLDWPLNYSPEAAELIEQMDGAPFADVCHAAVNYLSGGQPEGLQANYERADLDDGGRPQWELKFPQGSVPDNSLTLDAIRNLAVRKEGAGWKIVWFGPPE